MAENEAGKDYAPDETPDTDDLAEPSVAKEPGEEPQAPELKDEEPSHHAVGIGIVESGTPGDDSGDAPRAGEGDDEVATSDPGEDPDEDPYEA